MLSNGENGWGLTENLLSLCTVALTICAVFFLMPSSAKAHDAGGWQYPHECCHDTDCAVIDKITEERDGSVLVTTKHGTARFPKGHPRKDSPDGRGHACFTPTKLYCLFCRQASKGFGGVPKTPPPFREWAEAIVSPG